jgi:hypothetical protein
MSAGRRSDGRGAPVDHAATRRQFLLARAVLAQASAQRYGAIRKMREWPTSQRDLVIASRGSAAGAWPADRCN